MLLNPPPNPLPISMPPPPLALQKNKGKKKEKHGDKRGGSGPSSPNPDYWFLSLQGGQEAGQSELDGA